MQHRFRFGVINEQIPAPADWFATVGQIEQLGYATLLIRDHFIADVFGDQLGPIAALAAAAAATTTLRVGTLVFDNDYRHPVLLAKECATIDYLSGGRFELGIGAGWLRAEYDQAGMPFETAGVRIDRFEEGLQVIKGMWADEPLTFTGKHYRIEALNGTPKPLQQPHPPILIGGGQRRMLTLAGREADIVSILTTSVASGAMVQVMSERTPDGVRQKLAWVRAGAGERFPEIELSLIPSIVITDTRRATTEAFIHSRSWDGVSVENVWAMPSVLIGSVEQIVDELQQRRDEYGFSYYVIGDDMAEQCAPIVARLAGR
ncbi:MAG: TIGR03621 family F420-dependent LLM class oxidoreductase [Roseiflexaceae bacterium]|nr:TIGR03621 family F420-dependent LLM class oxidoreductase [Roseiflexaceae bacterium]